ncbi:T9SS type B sorting domain-containing protein [Salegentibacter chungangensis]|uniref:T9SS type B sorting domain-containing protein n=1 Tax=Salegentibacter chungangensis TaxID=1335724 RepID=A0ABW3NV74_9FLAO
MKKRFILGLIFFFCVAGVQKISAQGSTCATLEPFCSGSSQLVFANTNIENSELVYAETGPDYGCLETQPYPAWFFLQIESPGDLLFTISQFQNKDGGGAQLDVDFIVWGPFERDSDFCVDTALNEANIIDCSYEPDTVENMSIDGAEENEIYIVLITNFEEEKGYISLQQTNTGQSDAGSTDCSILESTLGEDIFVCGGTEVVLDGTTEGADSYKWYIYDADSAAYELLPDETGPTLIVSSAGNYKIVVADEFGEDEDDIYVGFYDNPVASDPGVVDVCSDGERGFDLTSINPEVLRGNNSSENYKVLYYESRTALENNIPVTDAESFRVVEDMMVFAIVEEEESGCSSEPVAIELRLNSFPQLGWNELTVLCLNEDGSLKNEERLGAELGEEYSYEWRMDGELVSEAAIYTFKEVPQANEISLRVTAKKANCSVDFSSQIQMFSAPDEVQVEVAGNDFSDGYTVTAEAIGENPADYQYRLDEGGWQEAGVFAGVSPGNHYVVAREVNGCGETRSESFHLFGYPRFFTPNGDGYNDNWKMITNENISIKVIHIFDRYGRLLKQLNANEGWDGIWKDRRMPADDYWFKIEYRESPEGGWKQFSSHFSLVRKQ